MAFRWQFISNYKLDKNKQNILKKNLLIKYTRFKWQLFLKKYYIFQVFFVAVTQQQLFDVGCSSKYHSNIAAVE